MRDLILDGNWLIDAKDLEIRHARSGGPGGQNVNKVSTKVEVRLALSSTVALTPAQKQRLVDRYPSHVTGEGQFVITSDRFRSQVRNLDDARARMVDMILSIRKPPKKRVATKATQVSRRKRLDDKRRRSDVKRARRAVGRD